MLFDECYSGLGRSTSLHLSVLRVQLGTGVDPAFDYSKASEQSLQQKLERKAKAAEKNETHSSNAVINSLSGPDLLRHMLNEAEHGSARAKEILQLHEVAYAAVPVDTGASASTVQVRVQRERPSSAFLAPSRETRERLKAGEQCGPPLGTYTPNPDLGRPRTPTTVGFGARRGTKSRRESSPTRAESELCGGSPDNRKPHVSCPDLAKLVPRPDLMKSSGIVCTESFSTGRLLDGDLHLSTSTKQPCFLWSSSSREQPKQGNYSSEPGKYNGNVDAVRPRSAGGTACFGKQVGRRPVSAPSGHCARMSSADIRSQHVPVPDISKQTPRPPLLGQFGQTENSQVLDLDRADNYLKRRPRTAGSFQMSLTRQEQLQSMRSYGEDVCLQQQQENRVHGPKSVELLSGIIGDGPLWERPIVSLDFARTPGRECGKKHALMPSRFAKGKSPKFRRGTRVGDARCSLQDLSQLASAISELRAIREHEPHSCGF